MQKTYDTILQEYKESYDVDSLVNPNDKANLDAFIRLHVLITKIQTEIDTLSEGKLQDNIVMIRQLQDTLSKLIEQAIAIEKTLGIDRKSRKKDTQESVADYIVDLKTSARDWLEKQFIKIYCKNCNIMVARIIPAHEHTQFDVKVQCTQCGKFASAVRKEKDIFFDVKERNKEWRNKYPVTIVHPTVGADIDADEQVIEDA